MSTKEEKINDINKAIHKSRTALNVKAKAEILSDGRIQYSYMMTSGLGKPYRAKVSFRQILNLLHGEDIRALAKKYSK